MSWMHEAEDDRLLEDLRRLAARFDPPPPRAVRAAVGSLAWRRVDAELAELAFDSAEEEQPVGVRGGGQPRLLTFSGPVTLELEVAELGPRRRRLLGQVVPPSPATVEVRYPGGSVTVEADASGMFAAEEVPAGPVSLRCRPEGQPVVQTNWTIV